MRRKNAAQELQPPAVEAAAVLDSEADIEHFKGVGTEEQLVAQLDSKDEEECAGAEPVAEPNSREEASAAEASDTEATEEANENTASETADSEHSNDEQASEPAHQSIVSLVTSDFAMQVRATVPHLDCTAHACRVHVKACISLSSSLADLPGMHCIGIRHRHCHPNCSFSTTTSLDCQTLELHCVT